MSDRGMRVGFASINMHDAKKVQQVKQLDIFRKRRRDILTF
jgi:hypothetical protein